jgi:hypothetical protein
MFLDKFLAKIGDFFSGLFNAARRTWKKLSPDVQNAMIHASGVIDIINNNVDKVPDFVVEIIQKKFPDLDLEKLKVGLHAVGTELNLLEGVNDPDLLTLIEKLQKHLESKQGKAWALISSSMSQILAVILAPAETKVAAIISLIEFVYQHFIKKS